MIKQRIIYAGECILWNGRRDKQGYGNKTFQGKTWKAHRWMFHQTYGPIPPEIWVLHSCDNPPCINPEHLFLGTQSDNLKDCVAKGRYNNQNTIKIRCMKGHPFSIRSDGGRYCKICASDRSKQWFYEHHAYALERMKKYHERMISCL